MKTIDNTFMTIPKTEDILHLLEPANEKLQMSHMNL